MQIDPEYEHLLDDYHWTYKDGYFNRGDKGKTIYLHRMIYQLGNGLIEIPAYHEVHHINEDISDNRLCNLQLLEKREHSRLHGLKRGIPNNLGNTWGKANKGRNNFWSIGNTYGKKLAGNANGNSKVTDQEWLDSLSVLFSGGFSTRTEVARYLGVSITQVTRVIEGRNRPHLKSEISKLFNKSP